MSYIPTGTFSTSHKMRLMLAACATVQELLLAADANEAYAKIATYGVEADEDGVPQLTYPRALVHDAEVHMQTGQSGELLGIDLRVIGVWLGFYVPVSDDIDDVNDEHAWVNDQFSNVVNECLALSGRGESVAGSTHLCVENPVFYGAEKEPHDERGDENVDSLPELSRWFGLVAFEVH